MTCPFSAMEHNYNNSADFLKQKETLINFIGNFDVSENENLPRLEVDQTIHFFENTIASGLHRQVNVVADIRILRNNF